MLELKNITKEYEIGKKNSKNYQTVQALKGVDLCFRANEFVSILGPSGCGKTTMLNIIGGLDKYTQGDLIIKGKSTKEFKDKDWDNYRNHSVGFVFQSYNLIHHQTILQNVELALTLSGVNKHERKMRALEALDKVGLKDRANNLPNQLSGGQMQRVAIARAIVNDPDIILADEPTGALDSKTSVQIMDILKELSNDRLVIMVTHNPELAEQYSSRIVKLKDGELVSDSNPYTAETKSKKKTSQKPKKPKKRMSFFTALGLSFKNLLTKKARTILVAFAGSIGIIGIALILSVASGFQGYMNKVQEDTLSSYPIVIEEQSLNYMSIMSSMFTSNNDEQHSEDGVYANDSLSSIFDSFSQGMQSNDMKSFNTYLQEHYTEIEPYVNAIKYTYNIDFNVYDSTKDPLLTKSISPTSDVLYNMIIKYSLVYLVQNTNLEVDMNTLTFTVGENGFKEEFFIRYSPYSADLTRMYNQLKSNGSYALTEEEITNIITLLFRINISTYNQMDLGLFNEMIDNSQLIKDQYKLLYGNWNSDKVYEESGKKYVDTLLVLNDNNELDDYLLYALGFVDDSEIDKLFNSMVTKEKYQIKVDYNKIVGYEYKLYLDTAFYKHDGTNYINSDILTGDFADEYVTLRISGIVKTKDETNGGALDNGIVYPKALTDYCIATYNSSPVVTSHTLSAIDKNSPKTIAIYANSFEMKDVVENFITTYNNSVDENQQITYTDYMSLMMDAVNSIVNTVSYVLIAFVSVSLVVSSIMIGIITYISVLERTKEIGVLRSVGASKKDIKRVFTAESLIIGFTAGMLGILITLLLCIPINLIFKSITGISTIASLPIGGGIILVAISMLLTFIAGLIPAGVASKKDPVIALRTE